MLNGAVGVFFRIESSFRHGFSRNPEINALLILLLVNKVLHEVAHDTTCRNIVISLPATNHNEDTISMNATDDPMSCSLNAIDSFMKSDAALPLKPLAERIGATWSPSSAEASIEDEQWG